ncbi:unnamed protein product [Mytilus edulis]|uniref:Uncharacterized protein n=1 Tax=Mytilus edulis TaxID=6550 RepID=A0A8S3SNQ3_MYTED|nr:unnamed protein product [Mytilus edulis]
MFWHVEKFRKSDVNTVSQLVKIVDNSAKCNRSEVYNENDDDEHSLKWYRWDNFFTNYFKPLRGIGKFHHFRFTSDKVGVVFARETLDQPEKRLALLKESTNVSELLTSLPEVIQPAGLTEERMSYLYNEVRPFSSIISVTNFVLLQRSNISHVLVTVGLKTRESFMFSL